VLTRLVKLGIALVFHAVCEALRVFRLVFRKPMPGTFTVLTYHSVKPEHSARFARQMDALLAAGRPARASMSQRVPAGERRIAVTFDDAFDSLSEHALPELRRRRIPCTLFVPAAYAGSRPAWIRDPSHHNAGESVMDKTKLRELSEAGTDIGSHGLEHVRLALLSEDSVRREIRKSKEILEGAVGSEIELLAFPYGSYNRAVLRLCREAGYGRVFSNIPSFPATRSGTFLMGRIDVSPAEWPLAFWLKLRGAYQWMPLACRIKRMLLRPKTRQPRKIAQEA